MLEYHETNQFKKDRAKLARRGYNMDLLDAAMDDIIAEVDLDASYSKHKLHGQYEGRYEIHIGGRKSDWITIYYYVNYEAGERSVTFDRTGTHSDLLRSK